MSKLKQLLFCGLLALSAFMPVAYAKTATPDTVEPDEVLIPVKGTAAFPGAVRMHTQVFKPPGRGPFPVLLYSHGRSPDKDTRAALEHPIPNGHVRYWLAKGFAVVAPVRPGYGETGGADREISGARFSSSGACTHQPDLATASQVAAASIRTALDWVRQQPWANRNAIILEGTSVGGMSTVALAASNPPGVVAYINFSGGGAGNPELAPGHSCGPDVMQAVYREYGKTTSIPNIWLYATNDQFWGPDAPIKWHAAFAAGGSRSEFVHTAPVPGYDGHQLMLHGGKLWSVPLNRFLADLGYN